MATDVYRAPEMRHRVGERHHSIWEGSGGAGMLPWKGCNGGCRTGAVSLPVPSAPARLRDPGLLPAEGSLDLYGGFCLSSAVESSQEPLAQESQGWEFAVSWRVLALALPHSLSLQNTSMPLPELPGAVWAAAGADLSSSAMASAARPILAAGWLPRGAEVAFLRFVHHHKAQKDEQDGAEGIQGSGGRSWRTLGCS